MEWQTYRDLRLAALADAPDAFSSTLEQAQERSDSQWASRLEEGQDRRWNLPMLAEVNGQPAGLVWGHIEKDAPSRAELYQMWVAPNVRQQGLGKMLLDAVILWAREQGAVELHLGVTLREGPAMRLYTRAGFVPAGAAQPLRPGSEVKALPMKRELIKDAG